MASWRRCRAISSAYPVGPALRARRPACTDAPIWATARSDQTTAITVWKPDGSTTATTIHTTAGAAHTRASHGRRLPTSRSRRLRCFVSVTSARPPQPSRGFSCPPDGRRVSGPPVPPVRRVLRPTSGCGPGAHRGEPGARSGSLLLLTSPRAATQCRCRFRDDADRGVYRGLLDDSQFGSNRASPFRESPALEGIVNVQYYVQDGPCRAEARPSVAAGHGRTTMS